MAWVVALAALNPPSRVSFLLVDFKGGAAFAPLAGLPHVIGTLSDLDGRLAARAVESLRAELRRRERLLAERAARSIDELPAGVLARLVIVVDEFAAVVAEHPELQPVFADLAARGRSLGLHLVLCTQRPSGVIRDAVLANITLRISLRVTDRADSVAVIGTDAAAALPVEPPGRALVADGAGVRLVQLALAGRDDVAALRAQPGAEPDGVRPWCDPLPERIPLSAVPRARPRATPSVSSTCRRSSGSRRPCTSPNSMERSSCSGRPARARPPRSRPSLREPETGQSDCPPPRPTPGSRSRS